MRTALYQYYESTLERLQPPAWLIALFSFVALSDIAITYYALYSFDSGLVEQNDLAVTAMQHFGAPGLLVPYLLGASVWLSLSLLYPRSRFAFRALGVGYIFYASYVLANNIVLVHTTISY